MEQRFDIVDVAARIAHEANRVYCNSLGDRSQPIWEQAPAWQKESARAGVRAKIENPDFTPEMSHESWSQHKLAEGWKWGPVKDPEAKEHPCLVPYEQLPAEQQAKDHLFTAVVGAFLAAIFPERRPH